MERKETGSEISSIDIAPIPPGRLRQRFLAVGGGADNTVRILSLDPDDCLQVLSVQALPSVPESLCMLRTTAPAPALGAQPLVSRLRLKLGCSLGCLGLFSHL